MRSRWPSAERSSIPSRSPISRLVSPSATRAATSRCRAVRVGGVGPRTSGSPRNVRIVCDQRRGVAGVREVGAAGQDLEPCVRDLRGDQPGLRERRRPVLLAVHDEGRRAHPVQRGRHVDLVAQRQQRGRGRGRGRRALVGAEGGSRPGRRVRREDVGQHVGPETPVPGHQPDDVVADLRRPDVGAARPPAVQHQPVDRLRVPGRPLDHQRYAERARHDVRAIDSGRGEDGLDHVELAGQRGLADLDRSERPQPGRS